MLAATVVYNFVVCVAPSSFVIMLLCPRMLCVLYILQLLFVMQVCGLLERSVPTAAGLLAIPFIVHPIDNAVHAVLNRSLRPYMRGVICDGAGGRDVGLDMCLIAYTDDEGSDASSAGASQLSSSPSVYIACE